MTACASPLPDVGSRARLTRGEPQPWPGTPGRGPNAGHVVVFSGSDVLGEGLIALLGDGPRARVALVADLRCLEQSLQVASTVIVDAGAVAAGPAARLGRSCDAAVVGVAQAGSELPRWLLEDADAILFWDDVDETVLRMAISAAGLGMRLVSRRLPPVAEVDDHESVAVGECARRALALLADGKRDAELARELGLSESAVRKLVQRTVQRVGARTRCEAVAAFVRAELEPNVTSCSWAAPS